MTKIISFLLLAVLISSSASEGIEFTDENKILTSCTELSRLLHFQLELDSFEAGKCWGYISANIDVFNPVKYGSSRIVCIPEDKEPSDLVKILIEYLKEHPNDLNDPANQLIIKAFSEIYPCPQTEFQSQSPE